MRNRTGIFTWYDERTEMGYRAEGELRCRRRRRRGPGLTSGGSGVGGGAGNGRCGSWVWVGETKLIRNGDLRTE